MITDDDLFAEVAPDVTALARVYHGLGINVVPLGRDKKPIAKWKRWQTEQQSTESVEQMPFRDATGVAGLCGAVSAPEGSVLACIDADEAPGRAPLDSLLGNLGLPRDYAWAVHTPGKGGGWHVWLFAEGLAEELLKKGLTSGSLWAPFPGTDHIELKWSRVYAVLPGSAHPDGGLYKWEHGNGAPPAALPATVEARRLVLLGKWRGEAEDGKPAAAAPLPDRIAEGAGRHLLLASFAGSMRRRGASEATMLAALRAENKEKCVVPISDADLEHIAHSMMSYSPGDPITKLEKFKEGAPEPAPLEGLAAWAAETLALSLGAREEARQQQIVALKGICEAPARMVDAYLAEVSGNGHGKDAPTGLALSDAEPWPDEVDGAELLEELAGTFTRFVALPEAGAEALALYTILTFVFDAFFILPMLAILSAVKRSGKTTALAVILSVASRPLPGSNITASALFRAVDKHHPTLVIDEADSFLRENEEMRGILNAGHTRATAYVIRNVPVGDGYEPMQFSVWCPKIVAGIGKLAATLEDRSIIINARRRAPGEQVDRLRLDRLSELEPLRRRCRRWADDHVVALGIADPVVPNLSSDRAADNWRPMLAIADAAGGEWPGRARWAAIMLGGCGDESDGASVMLLEDMRDLFARRGVDRLTSADVAQALSIMEERPWPEWYHGKAISVRQVAKLLHGFGIRPKVVRFDEHTSRGYEAVDFTDAWTRYLNPLTPSQTVTSVTSLQNGTFSSVTPEKPVTVEKHVICRDVTDVTDESPLLEV